MQNNVIQWYYNEKGVRAVTKRVLSLLLALAIILLSRLYTCAEGVPEFWDLSRCRNVYAYSGKNCAYFYGFNGGTLVSARAIPDSVIRSCTVEGVIYSACHSEDCAYGLFKNSGGKYAVLRMDMNSGRWTSRELNTDESIIHTSFAASGDEYFVLVNGVAYNRVLGINGDKTISYTCDMGASRLFVNADSAYMQSFSGDIYRIGGGTKTLCLSVSPSAKAENAGYGYIGADGALLSLAGGQDHYNKPSSVVTEDGVYTDKSALTLAAAGNRAAVLHKDYSSEIVDTSPRSSEDRASSARLYAGGVAVIASGTSVSNFLKEYPEASSVLDKDGNRVTSGSIRTNYRAKLSGGECLLAVRGDINPTGTVNGSDVKSLMNELTVGGSFSECVRSAADCNGDGSVDNRDLVILARMTA